MLFVTISTKHLRELKPVSLASVNSVCVCVCVCVVCASVCAGRGGGDKWVHHKNTNAVGLAKCLRVGERSIHFFQSSLNFVTESVSDKHNVFNSGPYEVIGKELSNFIKLIPQLQLILSPINWICSCLCNKCLCVRAGDRVAHYDLSLQLSSASASRVCRVDEHWGPIRDEWVSISFCLLSQRFEIFFLD